MGRTQIAAFTDASNLWKWGRKNRLGLEGNLNSIPLLPRSDLIRAKKILGVIFKQE